MAKNQCPLCRIDFGVIKQAKGELPRELVEKIIEATSCGVGSELASWDPFFSSGVESEHPWDGKIPLCIECTAYFEDLWDYEQVRTKQGIRWDFTPRDKQRQLELHEVDCYCAATANPRVSITARIKSDTEKKGERDLEVVLDEVKRKYIRTKTNPYNWNSGLDYFPLVNLGDVTFTRQALYEVGINAAVVRRLKVVAIQYLKDHLNTERGFRLEQHEGQLETLKRILQMYRERLDDRTRLQLSQIGSEVPAMILEYERNLEQYRNHLRADGWLPSIKGGHPVQRAFNKALYDANGITNEVLGEESWKVEKIIHGRKHQITKGRLLGSLLLLVGILDWPLKYEVLEGWVLVEDKGQMVTKIRKACDSHRKHSMSPRK